MAKRMSVSCITLMVMSDLVLFSRICFECFCKDIPDIDSFLKTPMYLQIYTVMSKGVLASLIACLGTVPLNKAFAFEVHPEGVRNSQHAAVVAQ